MSSANPPTPPTKRAKCDDDDGGDDASARRVAAVAGHVAGGGSATSAPSANDNFYLHVNKTWLDHPDNAIPDEYSQWGGFTKLHDEGLKKQIAMVKELKSKSAADCTEEERKISAIWEASAARFAAWERGEGSYAPLAEELAALDAVLDSGDQALDKVAGALHHTKMRGIRNVFDFDKGSDLKNVNNVVLDFSTTGLSLPSREYYTEDNFAPKREAWEAHLGKVVALLEGVDGGGDGGAAARAAAALGPDFVANVVSFEHELAATMMKRAQSREYDKYYTNTTLAGLYEQANELRSLDKKEENYAEAERNFQLDGAQLARAKGLLERLYTLFGFRERLAANLAKNYHGDAGEVAGPPKVDHVTAYDGDGIRRVLALVTRDGVLPRYRSYLQYKALRRCSSFCTKELDDEFFDFYSRTMTGQADQKPPDKRSIGAVNAFAGEMMGKVFVARLFPPECKADVRGMIDETLTVMRGSIESADWLTPATRQKAVAKLAKFNVKIGYPDKWKDYSDFDPQAGDSLHAVAMKATAWKLRTELYDKINSVLDRTEWRMTPQTVNAYFMPTQNEIVFPAAILQPPFYHKSDATVDFDVDAERAMVTGGSGAAAGAGAGFSLMAAANFGGIGAVIAHEITHGYDDKGRKFDGDGNLNDWWSEEDATLFKAKCDIMERQAGTYTFVDEEDGGKTYKQNPQLTMGENLADLGGLSLSLKALAQRLNAGGGAGAAAQADVARASMRVAFKSWAAIWKLNIKKDNRINRLTTDPHAPCDFRGNLVNHMDEFYACFGVSPGDGMYVKPEDRLRMW